MTKPFRDEAEIYQFILVAKSTILSLSSVVENQLEVILSSHFSVSQDDFDLFGKMFFPKTDGLPFGNKIGIFEKLLNEEEPTYLQTNPDFLKSIRRIKDLRNNFAHAMDQEKKRLKKYVGKKHFDLDYLEEGKMLSKQFTIDDIKERYDEARNITKELQQFNIRDEARKEAKIAKIKSKKP